MYCSLGYNNAVQVLYEEKLHSEKLGGKHNRILTTLWMGRMLVLCFLFSSISPVSVLQGMERHERVTLPASLPTWWGEGRGEWSLEWYCMSCLGRVAHSSKPKPYLKLNSRHNTSNFSLFSSQKVEDIVPISQQNG